MEILTPLQKRFILKFSESPSQKNFFLTGGTALSAFYLHHRLSEDLDFFTEESEGIREVLLWLPGAATELELKLKILRQSGSFIDCFFESPSGEILNVDFAQDSPFRFEKIRLLPEYKIYVDNSLDIACNKLSALFDRAEAKDFVDIYFLHHEILPFEEILVKAKEKHIGLDDYWLAQALVRVRGIEKLPRMLKELNLASLKDFFLAKAEKLIKS